MQDVRGKSISVDRKYYLKSLYTPMINLFLPIVRQRRAEKNEVHPLNLDASVEPC